MTKFFSSTYVHVFGHNFKFIAHKIMKNSESALYFLVKDFPKDHLYTSCLDNP